MTLVLFQQFPIASAGLLSTRVFGLDCAEFGFLFVSFSLHFARAVRHKYFSVNADRHLFGQP